MAVYSFTPSLYILHAGTRLSLIAAGEFEADYLFSQVMAALYVSTCCFIWREIPVVYDHMHVRHEIKLSTQCTALYRLSKMI